MVSPGEAVDNGGLLRTEFLCHRQSMSLLLVAAHTLVARTAFSTVHIIILHTMQWEPAHRHIQVHMIIGYLTFFKKLGYVTFALLHCFHEERNVSDYANMASLIFQVCPICLTNPKDMAFGCGHQVSLYLRCLCSYNIEVVGTVACISLLGRLVLIVGKCSNYAPFAGAQSKLE